jgi:hypothetical protein
MGAEARVRMERVGTGEKSGVECGCGMAV